MHALFIIKFSWSGIGANMDLKKKKTCTSHFTRKGGRLRNVDKTCNAFLIIERLKATTVKAWWQAQSQVPRETLDAPSLYHL